MLDSIILIFFKFSRMKSFITIVCTLFYSKYELKLLMKGEFYMAKKSANLYARIGPHRGLPFELKIPNSMPVDINTLSEEEFNNELEKGYADMQAGRTKNVNTVFADIRKDKEKF